MGTETGRFVVKTPKVGVQAVTGLPLHMMHALKILPLLWFGGE